MKRLSEQVRSDISSLIDAGLSSRQIASRLNLDRRTIDRVRTVTRPHAQKNLGGRPPKLNATAKRRLVRHISFGMVETAAELARQSSVVAGIEVSVDTIRRTLREAGLKSFSKIKKPRLSSAHRRKRLEFAICHQHWTIEDWKRVVWSDETKINRLGSDGRKWVWKKPNTPLDDRCVQGTVKFGGGSLMIWGCMTSQGVGYCCQIEGKMNAALYCDILGNEFLDSLSFFQLSKRDIIFQQDNDPKHTSLVARKWFIEHRVEVLQWPSQSPDLNPIEHLWEHLKRQLNKYETEATSMHQLWERVAIEWENIHPEVCINLIESMPRRISAIIKAKGGHTKY
jgi:transposase